MPNLRESILPSSKAAYERILERAFGRGTPIEVWSLQPLPASVLAWKPSQRAMLHAAVVRALDEAESEVSPRKFLRPLGGTSYEPKLAHVPGENECRAYEEEARHLPPGKAAIALFPLATGVRSRELLTLDRRTVEHALKSGQLHIVRKGGGEQALPAEGAASLLADLLATTANDGTPWETVGEILSKGQFITQYHRLHDLIRDTGREAGIERLRPHILRHAFATRMMHDGAALKTIQRALGHKQMETTARYTHPEDIDLAEKMRDFGKRKP